MKNRAQTLREQAAERAQLRRLLQQCKAYRLYHDLGTPDPDWEITWPTSRADMRRKLRACLNYWAKDDTPMPHIDLFDAIVKAIGWNGPPHRKAWSRYYRE